MMVLQDELCEKCGEQYTEYKQCRWCRPCQMNHLKKNFTNWTSGNKKIDNFIQETQLKIYHYTDLVFEWIPYSQFNEVKEIGKYGSDKAYSAIWNDGPLLYTVSKRELQRVPGKKVVLKSQSVISEVI